MPRIFLNASNLKIGGLKQVALNFILGILKEPEDFDWHYAISNELAAELKTFGVDHLPQSTIIPKSPAKNIKIARQVLNLANQAQPDIVFTFGGPAYIKFKQPHLMGMNEPWVSHAGKAAFQCLGFPGEWLKFKMLTAYKSWWTRYADWWVTELEVARQGLHRRLGLPLERISIVSNSAAAWYGTFRERRGEFPTGKRPFRMLCFCAAYKHKNLGMLPKIAKALKKIRPDFDFEFVLTLPGDGPDWQQLKAVIVRNGLSKNFVNQGAVFAKDGPELYRNSDCLFLPTVLETFSATYPEAMSMGLPIVTPELDYLQDVCRDAALYYPPYDAERAAQRILELTGNEALWNQLLDAGKKRLQDFPSPQTKKSQYYEVLRQMLREFPQPPQSA